MIDAPHLPAASRDLTAAPRLGEHTRAVLAEAGLSDAKIDVLCKAGVARQYGE
jgi:crotonobetainyl-CoA:carnitine CoA-transferase CaiB-like acyl-CoA transferase